MQNAKENRCKPAFVQYNTVQVLKIELSGKELRVENNKKSLRIEATTTALQAFVDEVQSHVETARNHFANSEAAKCCAAQYRDRRVQYSTVQYSTVQYSTVPVQPTVQTSVQYSTVEYSTVTVLCSGVLAVLQGDHFDSCKGIHRGRTTPHFQYHRTAHFWYVARQCSAWLEHTAHQSGASIQYQQHQI